MISKFTLRLPPYLSQRLRDEAKASGVSLNQLILDKITADDVEEVPMKDRFQIVYREKGSDKKWRFMIGGGGYDESERMNKIRHMETMKYEYYFLSYKEGTLT